ncbi:toll/interleukin-1 receptor domain-containing protein [Frankia sp. AgB1.9]|uniref:TIR domain-containing protein n=1 Tax=unclassified Frankia TaxID=2632575 RepID=UPI0019313B56|nr:MULTISPECIES: TIR domain-containing protein [unclassified Frankia]MBL7494401.1 toll/interleukin-1 receptor domain-containing protein [Frankia sp. AgW1.1]MBL7553529.1 toll/interleukin-1 receptor domain-containing protein [Frankia sp. AgB1.9]MBL7622470.1 toll/interleukin-1 receptor domain-containing protein [Frankia sp. AgB1.8]
MDRGDAWGRGRETGQGPPTFFTSHVARDADNALVKRFHHDLEREVRLRFTGTPKPWGFLGESHLSVGQPFKPDLLMALCTAKVMVALLTDAYFTRPWCGREWAVFAERARLAEAAGLPRPPVLTVPWLRQRGPFPDSLPRPVRQLQLTASYLDEIYEGLCLVDLMRQRPANYDDLIIALADLVLDAAEADLLVLAPERAAVLSPSFGQQASPATQWPQSDRHIPADKLPAESSQVETDWSAALSAGERLSAASDGRAKDLPPVDRAAAQARDEAIGRLVELIESVDVLTEPAGLERWLQITERLSGQQLPRIASAYRHVVLSGLVELATRQLGPQLLQAMIDSLARVTPGNPILPGVRAVADDLIDNW